jgi:hypothetical protein
MYRHANDELVRLTHAMLADADATWSLGVGGGIAEFTKLPNDAEAECVLTPSGGRIVSGRGALLVELSADVRLVAHERPAEGSRSWKQEVVYCVPAAPRSAAGRGILTELGPDTCAARSEDAGAVLFELGLGTDDRAFCVRTSDPALIATLRTAAGEPILEAGHPALRVIKAAAPHRVCRSRIARLEVYQPIGSRSDNRPTPPGPHTHLSVPRTVPISADAEAERMPAGWIPALCLHPPHPLHDSAGNSRPFDAARHNAFQRLLERYAPGGWVEEKTLAAAAVRAGLPPERYPRPVRVALRQLHAQRIDSATMDAWFAAFEP